MALCPVYLVACLIHCESTATGAESGAKSPLINASSRVPNAGVILNRLTRQAAIKAASFSPAASSLPRARVWRPFTLCASGICQRETEEEDNQGSVGTEGVGT